MTLENCEFVQVNPPEGSDAELICTLPFALSNELLGNMQITEAPGVSPGLLLMGRL